MKKIIVYVRKRERKKIVIYIKGEQRVRRKRLTTKGSRGREIKNWIRFTMEINQTKMLLPGPSATLRGGEREGERERERGYREKEGKWR